MKVLVVDNSPEVAETVSLCFELRWPGTSVVPLPDGPTAMDHLSKEEVDLVILDTNLPGTDGFQVCRTMRRASQVPIIMLSVREEDTDVARGLEMGADDYIKKPFSHIELLARAHAVLRRVQGSGDDEPPFISGDLRVDFGSHEVWLRDRRIRLTPIEFNILTQLVKSAEKVVPHGVLLSKVWGPEHIKKTNYLKVHIQHLRQKLDDDPQNPRMIVTEWKVGYKFNRQHAGSPLSS